MKRWLNRSLDLLANSLESPQYELNELDWKTELSVNKKRLSEHLSAFANFPGGGFLVYGIGPTGELVGVDESQIEKTVHRLVNLGRDALEPSLALDHMVTEFRSVRLLLIHVPESPEKPVHLRGKDLEHAFIRSGETTRRASRNEIGSMMLHSRPPTWEELRSGVLMVDEEWRDVLEVGPILEMLDRPVPTENEKLLSWMEEQGFIIRVPSEGFFITNLGAIASAKKLGSFSRLGQKAIRVITYDGVSKIKTRIEQEHDRGYAISFRDLMEYVMSLLPQSEVIKQALRQTKTIYPEIALREIIANALIHQDFSITGAGPLVEIFDDRVEISNPGGLLPSKRLDRLIGSQPESRNERLARAFRLYKICEQRGSGLVKAGIETELYGLPPIQFEDGGSYFKVTLFTPRTFAQMSPRERLDACYQHTVLRYCSREEMTNKSLRERLKMPDRHRSMVSVLIQDAVEAGLIKPADPTNTSKKFARYIPAWA